MGPAGLQPLVLLKEHGWGQHLLVKTKWTFLAEQLQGELLCIALLAN